MKRVIPVSAILLFMLVVACSSTQKMRATSTADGLSYEKAIVVKSIGEEYEWIKNKYPGSKVELQSLMQKNGKPYDMLSITTASGEKKSIYFDISSFYGKF